MSESFQEKCSSRPERKTTSSASYWEFFLKAPTGKNIFFRFSWTFNDFLNEESTLKFISIDKTLYEKISSPISQ